tara:strand:+ start:587 stop:862 length:276 start_codon:yes stop_codon:yes gene_type:complete
MDSEINYPYGIPFYSDQIFIPVSFVNNDTELFNIYFMNKKIIGALAGIVFPQEIKKYHFPKGSIVAIILQSKPNKIQCYIKMKPNMRYIYP